MPLSNFLLSVIEEMQAKLLELSGRNTLISFRHSERSNKQVRIINTSINAIHEFLEDGRPIKFSSIPLPKTEAKDEQTPKFLDALELARQEDKIYKEAVEKLGQDIPVKALIKLENELRDRVRAALDMPPLERDKIISKFDHAIELKINPSYELDPTQEMEDKKRKSRLQTFLYPEEMDRKLSLIYNQARLSESETGINTLFCAFGFLEWYESDHSEKPIYSPLLLYPIDIERKVIEGEYVYSGISRDEEIAENICLQERLRRDFGLELFNLEEEEKPEKYLIRLERLIKKYPTWKLHAQITIGFFSFSKLVMYYDLARKNLEMLDQNSIITKLIEGSESKGVTFAEDYEVDTPKIRNKIKTLITDADSSQLSALVDVIDGKNLVIEGPPGTGKSQTITNIIAAALAEKKSVLFIAEKRAALEVVKKRLDGAGLGAFCLELHSNKTRKTDILKSLDEWLKMRRSAVFHKVTESLISEQERIKETSLSRV